MAIKASFANDYTTGAHPLVLQRLMAANDEPAAGYGADRFCAAAKEKIRQAFGLPPATQIDFMVGGTQTNATVIDALLRGYEGVVCAETGHIAVHEAGAIETGGHKVLVLPSADGKLTAEGLETYLQQLQADETLPHRVQPGLVYITLPTELGTLYSRAELTALHAVCRRHRLPLYIDGARLGYGLCSPQCDIDAASLARLCEVFYVGGTKCGALCGEAVVWSGMSQPAHFFTTQKQHGAVLAKGRVLGLQFDALFTDGLYFRLARHALEMAERLCRAFARCDIAPAQPSPTNQQFFALTPAQHDRLAASIDFEPWEHRADGTSIYRFATSWATTESDLAALEAALAGMA